MRLGPSERSSRGRKLCLVTLIDAVTRNVSRPPGGPSHQEGFARELFTRPRQGLCAIISILRRKFIFAW